MTRCAIYIDGDYLRQTLQEGRRLDYVKLSRAMMATVSAPDPDLVRAYYYTALPYRGREPSEEDRLRHENAGKFLYHLSRLPRFEVKKGRTQRNEGPSGPWFEQKGVDVMLGVDLARMSWSGQIGYAIVATTDSDFSYAVRSAKDAGVVVHLWHYTGREGWGASGAFAAEFDEVTAFTDEDLARCAPEQ